MTTEISILQNRLSGQSLRLETLIRVRWVAVVGQTAAVMFVWFALQFDFWPLACLALVALSALLNAVLTLKYPPNQRLSSNASLSLLAYDIIQLALLLYLTGGLQNPFAILLVVPVVISATTLSIFYTVSLGALAVAAASLLVFFHHPLPWFPQQTLELPRLYVTGMWIAIISCLSFTAIYAFRVADEARKLADALAATELVLQREQHLSTLDGLAAAAAHELGTPLATIALVSKEMSRELDQTSTMYEDAKLLRSQAERCREILQKLTSLSDEGDRHIGRMPFSSIMEEVAAPHRNFGVEVEINFPRDSKEPDCVRNPALMYGLGNLLENAVDFAKQKVEFHAGWDADKVWVSVNDDGAGFDSELLDRIGEPFVTTRTRSESGGGLGLGLFIAKTLLERTGATIEITNSKGSKLRGALIQLDWPRAALEHAKP